MFIDAARNPKKRVSRGAKYRKRGFVKATFRSSRAANSTWVVGYIHFVPPGLVVVVRSFDTKANLQSFIKNL